MGIFNIFIKPTSEQFIILFLFYSITSLLAVFFVSGFKDIFIAILVLNIYIFFHALLFHIETVLDSKDIKERWENAIIIIPIVAIIMGIFISAIEDKVKIHKLVSNKSELFEISGIVPNGASVKTAIKGKNRVFLRIGDARFHCAETINDDCEKIYQYSGKNATIYYQPILYNDDNLVYEIVVHDKVDIAVYNFDSQLKKFQDKRKKHRNELIFFVMLVLISSLYFFLISRHLIEELEGYE
ncbi:hypothetical protein [Moraxella oblonga]|uniref:hypothetical protein n=1 Tax=Moraxella oblonga TaxID=200413 RepID=UPI00082F3606|nr:hypothetical protein [Moraxella oblonga]